MHAVIALAFLLISSLSGADGKSRAPSCMTKIVDGSMVDAQAETVEQNQAPVTAGAPDNPSLGMGLAAVTDYAPQLPFINLMKSSRVWTAHVGGGWGGMSDTELRDEGYLDENGWPLSMPPGVTGIATLLLTDLPPDGASANGRYRLRYEGQGLIEISSAGQTVAGRRGEAWFNVELGTGPLTLTIIRTDPNGIGEHLRNFSIVKEENIAAFEAGEIFNPLWLSQIRDFRSLRFMDWMATNNSHQSEWAKRPRPDDYTYTERGVPLEVMIQLANEVGADPWFNIPHLATDDYIERFAVMVRDTLDPSLKAYVEFSNEVWNWGFDQAEWAEKGGIDRWGADSKWVQFYAIRASQMANIWDGVYGELADERLVKVIGTQTGWLGLEKDVLTAPMWTAEAPENAPPYMAFDAYAITGYFSARLGNEDAQMVLGWIEDSRAQAAAMAASLPEAQRADHIKAHEYDLAIQLAARELEDGGVTGDDRGSVAGIIGEFAYHAAVAQKYGLDLVVYEGGTHILGIGDWASNEDLAAFFAVLNYTPEMGALYEQLLDGWKQSGGTLFNLFVDVDSPSQWGSWGALRYLGDDNPRWDAIEAFNTRICGWWEERAPGTFDRSLN